jgi:hypothetical protein
VCFVFRSRGCSEFVFLDNRLQHETLCRFRPVSCQNERHGCDAIFSVKVKRHLFCQGYICHLLGQGKTPSFFIKTNYSICRLFGQGKTPSFLSRLTICYFFGQGKTPCFLSRLAICHLWVKVKHHLFLSRLTTVYAVFSVKVKHHLSYQG